MSTTTRPPIARNLRWLKATRVNPATGHHWKWSEVAEELDVRERLLFGWASDDPKYQTPTWPNVMALAGLFDVDPDFLYRDNPESRRA